MGVPVCLDTSINLWTPKWGWARKCWPHTSLQEAQEIKNHRHWSKQNTVRALPVISYLWGRWGWGDDRTKRCDSGPVREREEQEHEIKMRKCHLFHLFLRRECIDPGWSGSGSPSCRRSAPFPAPSMLHSSFHHATGLPLLCPSSPLLTRSHTLMQPTSAAQEVCRTTISAGWVQGEAATLLSLLIRHHTWVRMHTRSPSYCNGANPSL